MSASPAIGSPLLYSFILARFLGLFALVSGVISLLLAIFGKHKGHRLMEALSGIVRIAAGVILLNCLASSVALITLIFALYLIVEGIVMSVTAIGMRATPGWAWMLFSGLGSLLLGVLVYYPLAIQQRRDPGAVFRHQPPHERQLPAGARVRGARASGSLKVFPISSVLYLGFRSRMLFSQLYLKSIF